MTTRIAVNTRSAAYAMIEAGLVDEQIQIGVDTIKQPSKGYYYISDVHSYIDSTIDKMVEEFYAS